MNITISGARGESKTTLMMLLVQHLRRRGYNVHWHDDVDTVEARRRKTAQLLEEIRDDALSADVCVEIRVLPSTDTGVPRRAA